MTPDELVARNATADELEKYYVEARQEIYGLRAENAAQARRIAELELQVGAFLAGRMKQFPDSRFVDDDLVALAAMLSKANPPSEAAEVVGRLVEAGQRVADVAGWIAEAKPQIAEWNAASAAARKLGFGKEDM